MHFMINDPTTWTGRKLQVQEPVGCFTESPYGYDGQIVTVWDRAGIEHDLPENLQKPLQKA
eukprot:10557662-Karenia_brevis.AAC.1